MKSKFDTGQSDDSRKNHNPQLVVVSRSWIDCHRGVHLVTSNQVTQLMGECRREFRLIVARRDHAFRHNHVRAWEDNDTRLWVIDEFKVPVVTGAIRCGGQPRTDLGPGLSYPGGDVHGNGRAGRARSPTRVLSRFR